MNLRFQPTTVEDFGVLVDLRIDAMRESLEAIGRFDRSRSIERFRSSFAPEKTKKIIKDGNLAGFIAFSEYDDHLYLDHLYIDPKFQSLGIGSIVLKSLIEHSEKEEKPVRLGALRSSKSNDFYKRHGFSITKEDEFDIYYERKN
ncbi:MAG: GNAT family N-acetyltransferase [Opitutales bacterium]|nr:GNAT family N-acetyltransferase [Opitutales bacterium]